ncbi:MAG: MtnX-like HAD-IB family phosphatase [Acidobacteria bacterium]|nr:MtnX-like HAD-IB family phosphatase [Acidobacteriota bacterium]
MHKNKIALISDFDGTLTTADSLELLLDEFVDEDWTEYERMYEKGEITGSEALEREIALLNISIKETIEFLQDKIALVNDFEELYKYCTDNEIPFRVVSCNFEQIIRPLLSRNGYREIPLLSNRLVEKDGKLYISPGEPAHPECRDCHHCKMLTVKKLRREGYFTVYLGDGHTDRCAAWEADVVFAKSRLQRAFEKDGLKFYELESIGSVISFLHNTVDGGLEIASFYKEDDRDEKQNPFIKRGMKK